MRVAIMQPGYLPWLGFFELMYNCDLFVFLDDVQYTRRDWRSRNRIRTKEGWIWLSVPVLTKGRRYQLIKDVEIDPSVNWRKKHLKSIQVNYCKSRYFERYFPQFEEVYKCKWSHLAELDIELISLLARELGIDTSFIRSSALRPKGKGVDRIIDICKKLKADELYDSKAAANFIDIGRFKQEGIKVEFQDYRHPIYTQVYKPFIPYMSTIDLLFNHGPDSLRILLNK